MSAETLTAMAKAAGAAMLLDISQSLGWISVKLEKWGVDMAAFTGHKYLLGPQGTGGLYVRPGLTLRPYVLGGTGVKSDLREMPEEMPLHLEAGTGNEPSYHGLLAALRWAAENPLKKEEDGRNPPVSERGSGEAGVPGNPAKTSGNAGGFLYCSGLASGRGRRYFIRQL